MLASTSAGSAIAQQPANPPSATLGETAGQAVGTNGQKKGQIITDQQDQQAVRYQYFEWNRNCYVRYRSTEFAQAPFSYCSKPN